MKSSPSPGRILLNGSEAGPISAADVERRAHELARIRGVTHGYSASDLEAARRELHGDSLPEGTTVDQEGDAGASRDPSEPLSQPGHHVINAPAPDEQDIAEQLALEGVEEAQHEQMLADRRRPPE
ncbi:MAG TPA: hypothetical protein VGD81_07625 [Opitutaceae bacterium]